MRVSYQRDVSVVGVGIIGLIVTALLLVSCSKFDPPPEVSYVETTTLPSKLAVMPATFLPVETITPGEFPEDGESEKGKFIAELTRGVVHNQLAGKGYDMRVLSLVDQTLVGGESQEDTAKALCEKLEVDGLVYIEIATATMVTAVAYDLFKIEAGIKLVDKEGLELGTWQDNASKRKISLPTSPVGVATTIAVALLDESARKQMRLVVYDWGWKVSRIMPDSPMGRSVPEIVYVDSNIDKKSFALGDQITVEVAAEKDLTGTFDLGDFKKGLPLSHTGDGIYKGVYVVQEGDYVSNQPMSVRLLRSNGVERSWLETGGTVTLDGVPPPPPENVEVQTSRKGVRLSWALPQGEDLDAFTIEKSESAVGDFRSVASLKDLTFMDGDVAQGHSYFYRVRSVDRSGNLSLYEKTIPVTMPFYDEVSLQGSLSGSLVSGVYRIEGQGIVAHGNVLEIGAGSKVNLSPDARIVVNGTFKVNGSPSHPVIFEGQGWQGLVVGERGEAELIFSTIKGCAPCLEIDGGSVVINGVSLKGGMAGDGIVIHEDGLLAVKGGQIRGFDRGIVMFGGNGTFEESTISNNEIGIDIIEGRTSLNHTNVFDNGQINLRTEPKLVLESNYFGETIVKDLKLEGDVLVKSLLDAPFPHGRTVVLVDDADITAEVLDQRFNQYRDQGIEAFKQRRFGDAHQALVKALKVKEDKDAYLYLAYTQSSLGEEERMAQTLDRGIMAFPYEVRLYQIYVKYLAANGEKQKALTLLEKAEKMNPEDQSLAFMRQYIEAME